MLAWYCVHTHRKAEDEADMRLREQGFTTFLPTFPSPRGILPLFPRYMFVAFDIDHDPWRRIVSTGGVVRLLSSAPEKPTPIRDEAIDIVRDQMEIIREEYTPRPAKRREIYPGIRVRLRSGQFHHLNLTGICKWTTKKRLAVLFQFMNREVEIVCRYSDVAIAEQSA